MAGEDPIDPTTWWCADSGLFLCYAGSRVPDVSPPEHVRRQWCYIVKTLRDDQQSRGRHDDLRYYAGQLSIPTDDLHLVTCDEKQKREAPRPGALLLLCSAAFILLILRCSLQSDHLLLFLLDHDLRMQSADVP